MISMMVVVLPQPDSPTSPSVSPRLMSSETPSTARTLPTVRRNTAPLRIGNARCRSASVSTTSRWSRGWLISSLTTGAGRTNTSAAVHPRWAISTLRWQAAKCCWRSVAASSGSVVRHCSTAIGQRGANGHPAGKATSEGGLPSIGINGSFSSTSIRGIEPSRPIVYGIRG